uniref:Uncharacterized protein n=1 Tax=Cannabis sativa TaxID=3483 RepID=A0A803P6E6_CANSA
MFSFQEKYGGRPIQSEDIMDAQSWLALGQVEEFKSSGSFYTWTNKHEVGDRIFSKLDRVFINNIWLDEFPNTDACFKWEVWGIIKLSWTIGTNQLLVLGLKV